MSEISRRQAMAVLAASAFCASAGDDPWAALPQILKRIQPPKFPNRDFEITRYGAKADGKTDCTDAFRDAIAAANKAGGGRVVVPEGIFLTGAIHLKSNVNLHVSRGATVRFIPDPKLYPIVLTRYEGTECMNYSPFFYAWEQQNIAITGPGTLDGHGGPDHWWNWTGRYNAKVDQNMRKGRARLVEMADHGEPVEKRVFGDGWYMRPNFVQPYRSNNILIEDVTIINSPMWELNPVLCRNVTVRNVNISSHGPNNDGCDPESCIDVLIDGCTFDTGDDCIAIKSGRNADGRRVHAPCENIIVQNCTMKDGHGGVTLGSECSGDIRNVYAQDCKMDSPHLDRVLRLKTNAMRGGVMEHVYMRNVQAGEVAGYAVEVDFNYEEGERGDFMPVVRDIEVVNLKCRRSRGAWSLRGFAKAPIRDVRLRDCTFEQTERPDIAEHVEGLALKGVTVNGKTVEG
jgi:polygalacturonase